MLIILCEILAAICSPLISYSIKNLIDAVNIHIDELSFSSISGDFYLLFFTVLSGVILNRLSGFTNMFTMPVLRVSIRRDVFKYLLGHSHEFYINNFSGSIGHRVTELSKQFSLICSMIIFHFIPVTIAILSTIAILFTVNIFFALCVVVWMVSYIIIALFLAKGLKKYSNNYAKILSKVSGEIVDSITNIFNIRAFANYAYEKNNLNKSLDQELVSQRKMFVFMEINRVFQGFANLVLLCGLVFLSIHMLIDKQISIGQFVMIYSMSFIITNNIDKISVNIIDFFEYIGSIKDAFNAINVPYDLADKVGAKQLKIVDGRIDVKNLCFTYHKKNQVFEQLNLSIKPKEKVGLVGVSGSGKTTFANLIMRFFELQKGNILIDNQNIQDVSQASLHKNIGIIPQEPILFNRTIFENIKYGSVNASKEQVIIAAKKARCHDFIMKLNNGYDALVGERGVKLSGGQKQRIAIARVILENAPIIIMDEATSALDSRTERDIQYSFKELIQDKTVIIIAHRLSTLNMLDRIIVFKEGKIIEDGSHQQLMQIRDGEYKKLWSMQSEGWLDDGEKQEPL